MLGKLLDAVLARDALAAARRQLAEQEGQQEHGAGTHLQQARLLAEVIRRVAEPSQTLPAGDRAPIILALARHAVFHVLRARAGTDGGAGELTALWDATPEAWLAAAVPEPAALPALRATLTGTVAPGAPVAADDATAARAFLERLLWNADAPRRQVERLLVRRFVVVVAVVLVVALLALGVRALTLGTNLAAGKPMRTSSSWPGCASDPTCEGVLLFHTNPENDPWVEFDLLKPQLIKRIDLTNRQDCCFDRTVPLVAEVSLDRAQWTEVGRRVEEFSEWSLKFPPRQARYVRLRIARPSTFHLKDVVIR
jgi:hypothetical protein